MTLLSPNSWINLKLDCHIINRSPINEPRPVLPRKLQSSWIRSSWKCNELCNDLVFISVLSWHFLLLWQVLFSLHWEPKRLKVHPCNLTGYIWGHLSQRRAVERHMKIVLSFDFGRGKKCLHCSVTQSMRRGLQLDQWTSKLILIMNATLVTHAKLLFADTTFPLAFLTSPSS